MATIYMQTTGNAANSGSSDQDSPDLSGSAATSSSTVVTLDGSPDLSALITTDGDTNSTISFAATGVSNRKIFKITNFDNTAKTVTLDQAPALSGSQAWRIGGRITAAGFNGFELGLEGGDQLIVNDDQTSTSPLWSMRGSGTSSEGYIKVIGKSGAYRKLSNTAAGSASIITESGTTSGLWFENLEFDSDGSSGTCLGLEQASVVYNCKFVDGVTGVAFAAAGNKVIRSEFTNLTTGIAMSTFSGAIMGCYIHGCTDGITFSGTSVGLVAGNVITKNTRYGIHLSGSTTVFNSGLGFITNNTIAWNDEDGLRITDIDTPYVIANNILAENGTTGSHYNLNVTPGGNLSRQSFMGWNLFSTAAARGGANVNGYTLQATDINSDPLFTNAGSDDFSLQSSSPAKAAAMPIFGFSSYLDIGAVQREEPTPGGGGGVIIMRRG